MTIRPRRTLTDADRHAWQSYAAEIARLPGTPPLPLPPEPVAQPDTPAAGVMHVVPPAKPRSAPLEVGIAPGGIDRSTWSRFRTGKLRAERTLDLHGRTLQRAHAELHAFLARAIADRLRCIEIITGRGSGEGGGAIRREFPLWLNSPALRPLVLAASHPHAANQGSVRLLLRRIR